MCLTHTKLTSWQRKSWQVLKWKVGRFSNKKLAGFTQKKKLKKGPPPNSKIHSRFSVQEKEPELYSLVSKKVKQIVKTLSKNLGVKL